jgi:putative transposase
MAARNGRTAPEAIFHSDRGSNYTSAEYAATLKELKIRQSVGRTGICYDNALAESFFAALKPSGCIERSTPPENTPAAILPATSNCTTILNVSTRDSDTGHLKRSTTSTRTDSSQHRNHV